MQVTILCETEREQQLVEKLPVFGHAQKISIKNPNFKRLISIIKPPVYIILNTQAIKSEELLIIEENLKILKKHNTILGIIREKNTSDGLDNLLDKLSISKKLINDLPKLPTKNDVDVVFKYPVEKLYEHQVWSDDIAPQLEYLSAQAVDTLRYAVTEMINNTIDHSNGEWVKVWIEKQDDKTIICIADDGVGIFEKIISASSTPKYPLLALAKGKLTTETDNHTGQGIFFSSRICDGFWILSHNKIFTHNNASDPLIQARKTPLGTLVILEVANNSNQDYREIQKEFEIYQLEDGFFDFRITKFPLRFALNEESDSLISRAEADIVMSDLDDFEIIILDFEGISKIGQGFADQIFRVYQNQNSQKTIKYVNANIIIEKEIKKALSNS